MLAGSHPGTDRSNSMSYLSAVAGRAERPTLALDSGSVEPCGRSSCDTSASRMAEKRPELSTYMPYPENVTLSDVTLSSGPGLVAAR